MQTGKKLLVTIYLFVLLLSGTHSAGTITNSKTVMDTVDSFVSLFIDERKESTVVSVVYALNGGVNHKANKTQISKKDFPVMLEIPTREGYNFAGWYTDKSYKNKITEINNPAVAGMVLYAKWTKEIDNYDNVEQYAYKLSGSRKNNQKTLKQCDYQFLDYISIPGMPATKESDLKNNYILEASQCMQGLCFTPDYILMTAYAESEVLPGSLMVFERETGEFLVNLKMKENSHLGGIAFDGENIWVCHSENRTLERISYSLICKIAESGARYCVDVSGMSKEYEVKNIPSCITCYGGRIWVATHSLMFGGEMISYRFDEEEKELVSFGQYEIPKRVQGVAFDKDGRIYFSTSYGRKNSSYLKVYNSLLTLAEVPAKPTVEVEMPPCSEEIVFADDSLYILFESASEKYFEGTDGNGKSLSPLDTLLEIGIASLW